MGLLRTRRRVSLALLFNTTHDGDVDYVQSDDFPQNLVAAFHPHYPSALQPSAISTGEQHVLSVVTITTGRTFAAG